MIVMLAAATLMLSAGPSERVSPTATRPAPTVFVMRVARTRLCSDAGRLQTSLAEPALLYRERDRDAARLRKLIDLPDGEMCLVGRAGAESPR